MFPLLEAVWNLLMRSMAINFMGCGGVEKLIRLLVQCVLHTLLTYQRYKHDHNGIVLIITWVLCVERSVQC